MTRIIARCVALFVFALPLPALALPFSNFYVIGDSLSDQGNLFAATTAVAGAVNALPSTDHYFQGRFSNGPVFTDRVAQQLGLVLTPSIAGGNNFAYGGARTDYNRVDAIAGGPFPTGLFPWSLTAEVAAFNARNINDPAGLGLVFSGSNDIADIIVRSQNPSVVIPNAVNGIISGVQAMANAGVKTVIVPNVPDLGLTPLFLSLGPAASGAATALSMQFNALLDARLALVPGDLRIIEIDTFNLFRDIVADPAFFGLTNVTTPCYTGFVEPNPTATECSNPDQFLFWDIVHPTRVVHAIFANAVIAAVPEPATLGLFALGLLAVGARRRAAAKS